MAVALRPTTELVAAAWLAELPELSPAMVGATLPKDATGWAATGFVQAAAVGGSPHVQLPVRRPVVQVDCWATKVGSQKPQWGQANALAEAIRDGAEAGTNMGPALTLPGDYPPARVLRAYLLTEPRRITGDASSYARYQFDLQMHWVAVP